jgi:branched-chain amino acid transport system ATP-binding protein
MSMLRIEGLVCGYGDMTVVHSIDLDVTGGEILALVGANGAGKSTTIMAIAGHVAARAGRILLDGQDVTDITPMRRVGAGIALAPEGRRVFRDMTVRENLIVGGHARDAGRIAVNIERVLALFPRLAERIGSLAMHLSGGEQQMLAIGRALMAEPRLLLIDEVSLGLMPKMIDICYAALARLRGDGLAIMIVEQGTSRALSSADRVAIFESGRIVWRGTASEARGNETLVTSYLGLGVA